MAKGTLQVVLRDDVENLGSSGELVRVKPGFARNFLLPRGLAAVATHGNVARIEHEKEAAIKRTAKAKSEASTRASELSAVKLKITAQAGESGKLFGSVGTKDIADAFAAAGVEVDKKKIILPEPIKEVGVHTVSVKIGYEVAATIEVEVVAAE